MRVVGPDTHPPTHKRSSDYRWPPVGKFDSIHQCHTVCPVFHISRVVEVGVLQNFYPLIRCSSRRRMGPAVRVVGHLQAPKRINWFVIIRRRRRRQQQQVHHVAILLYKPISVQETSCSAFKMMIDHGTCWPPPDPSPRRLLAKRAIFCPPVNKSVQLKTYKCVNIDGKKRKKNRMIDRRWPSLPPSQPSSFSRLECFTGGATFNNQTGHFNNNQSREPFSQRMPLTDPLSKQQSTCSIWKLVAEIFRQEFAFLLHAVDEKRRVNTAPPAEDETRTVKPTHTCEITMIHMFPVTRERRMLYIIILPSATSFHPPTSRPLR